MSVVEELLKATGRDFTRVEISGNVWVRHDAGSPEHALASARSKVAELTERVDVLEAALRECADIAHDGDANDTGYGYDIRRVAGAALERK